MKNNTGTFTIFIFFLAAVVAVGGGLYHVILKNSQTLVRQDIQKAEKRIKQNKLVLKTLHMKQDRQLNRYMVQEKLSFNKTTLIPISTDNIIEITPEKTEQKAIAQN